MLTIPQTCSLHLFIDSLIDNDTLFLPTEEYNSETRNREIRTDTQMRLRKSQREHFSQNKDMDPEESQEESHEKTQSKHHDVSNLTTSQGIIQINTLLCIAFALNKMPFVFVLGLSNWVKTNRCLVTGVVFVVLALLVFLIVMYRLENSYQ